MDRATLKGRVRESEIERVAEEPGLAPEALEDLRDQLAACDVEVEDDVGPPAAATSYANGSLAHYAIDALDQFSPRPPTPAAHHDGGDRAGQTCRAQRS